MPFMWLAGGLLGLAWPPGSARGPLTRRQGWLLAAAALLNIVPVGWAGWPGTTAGEIADSGAAPMFPLTRDGLNAAVDVLRGRLPSRLMKEYRR